MIEAIYTTPFSPLLPIRQHNPYSYENMVARWKLRNQDRNGVTRELCHATMLEF